MSGTESVALHEMLPDVDVGRLDAEAPLGITEEAEALVSDFEHAADEFAFGAFASALGSGVVEFSKVLGRCTVLWSLRAATDRIVDAPGGPASGALASGPLSTRTLAALPAGNLPVGTLSARTLPTGTLAAGTLPARTLPARTLPAGTLPTGTLPARTLPARTLPARTLPAGTLPSGAGSTGSLIVGGTLPLGTLPLGTLPLRAVSWGVRSVVLPARLGSPRGIAVVLPSRSARASGG